jgi:hypothetical protein
MTMPSIRRALLRGSVVATAAALMAALTGVASSAGAAAGSTLKATYPVKGSTFLKAPNFTLGLGPGSLAASVNLTTGVLTANLKLPDATGSFKQDGVVPVTATTQFINDGPTRGRLNLSTGAVRTTSKITLRIVDLKVSGADVPVGSSCETSAPVAVAVTSQSGFNPLKGGKLSGTYTIPDFANCELATTLINLTLPGSGNTITLTLGKAKIAG